MKKSRANFHLTKVNFLLWILFIQIKFIFGTFIYLFEIFQESDKDHQEIMEEFGKLSMQINDLERKVSLVNEILSV